jgi:hypothetical protein
LRSAEKDAQDTRVGNLRVLNQDELRRQHDEGTPRGYETREAFNDRVPPTKPAGLDVVGYNIGKESRATMSESSIVHERLHANTSSAWLQENQRRSDSLTEGVTEHFARKVLVRQEYEGGPSWQRDRAYVDHRDTAAHLESVVGPKTLQDAYLNGKTADLNQKLGEALGVSDPAQAQHAGRDMLNVLDQAMNGKRHGEANALLECMRENRVDEANAILAKLRSRPG